MMLPRKFTTCDPGWNTGLVNWTGAKTEPISHSLIRLSKELDNKSTDQLKKIDYMTIQFEAELKAYKPKLVVLEGVQFWGSNIASVTSFARGNAIGLSYLVGAYVQCCRNLGITVSIVSPTKWKGNMSDATVELRVDRALGKNWVKNNLTKDHGKTRKVHVAMAVGIGLDLRGIL